MTVTAFVLGGDAPGGMDHEATLTVSSTRPMIFQDSEVEMLDHVGGSETAFETSVDRHTPPRYARTLRDIIFLVHLDVFCRALTGDLPARKKPVAVRLHPGARVWRANCPPERNRLRCCSAESCPVRRSARTSCCQDGLEEAEST